MDGRSYRAAEQRLHLMSGYVAALADPHALVDAVAAAGSRADAVLRVQSTFPLDEDQAAAVLSLQFERATLQRLRAEIAEVKVLLSGRDVGP